MNLVITFIITIIALAIVEYLSHRLVMHYECSDPFKGTFDRHAIQHHKLKRFDINIDIPTWYVLVLGSPVILVLALFRLWGELAVFTTIIVLYAWTWTGMHRATHDLGGRWSTYLPFYSRIRNHHLEHHRRPGKNFGTIFMSLLDKPFGTFAKNENQSKNTTENPINHN